MGAKINSNTFKLGFDLFYIQMKWALWFIPIVFIVYVFLNQFIPEVNELDLNFLSFIFQPAKIFMLVIGILSCFVFLTYFVKNGITRKEYFAGSAIGAVGVAVAIMLISAILTAILILIGTFTSYTAASGQNPFLDTTSIWIIPILAYSLITITYYVAGWIIAIGFYRYGGWGGFGFIGIAILVLILVDLIWQGSISHPLASNLPIPFPDFSLLGSFSSSIVLIGLGLWLIRLVTKRVTIKLE